MNHSGFCPLYLNCKRIFAQVAIVDEDHGHFHLLKCLLFIDQKSTVHAVFSLEGGVVVDPIQVIESAGISWLFMPMLIFFATIGDVSLGTIRVIFVSRGYKALSAGIGFTEVLIWLFAIGQIMRNLDNPVYYLANAAGFALGIFTGMFVEEKLSIGISIVQIVTSHHEPELVNSLKNSRYGITAIDAEGGMGPVKVILSIVKREDIPHYLSIVRQFQPRAFFSIQNVRFVHEGIFPVRQFRDIRGYLGSLRFLHKGR
jgi:uncharacterized protein YebE (UPF0316 family)